jgi:hypothetical protein
MSEILLSNIKKEREGYLIDRNEMKGVLSMLLELGILLLLLLLLLY